MDIKLEQLVAIILIVIAIGIPAICLVGLTFRMVLVGFRKDK